MCVVTKVQGVIPSTARTAKGFERVVKKEQIGASKVECGDLNTSLGTNRTGLFL